VTRGARVGETFPADVHLRVLRVASGRGGERNLTKRHAAPAIRAAGEELRRRGLIDPEGRATAAGIALLDANGGGPADRRR